MSGSYKTAYTKKEKSKGYFRSIPFPYESNRRQADFIVLITIRSVSIWFQMEIGTVHSINTR